MMRRLLYTPVFHIDTNLINARSKLDAMNRLEKWAHDGVILINMSGTSFKEAKAGNSDARTNKANAQIFTLTDDAIVRSDALFQCIEKVLFPSGAKTLNEQNDVKIVYEAAKYAAILITNDGDSKTQPGGILGNRDKLKNHVQIMTASEAVVFVQGKIRERDERFVRQSGGALPPWTGQD